VLPPFCLAVVLLTGMNDLLTRLWRLGKPFRWRFLWLMHAKFICGVTGVIRDDDGNFLLLRHRLWPATRY
jgi:8-oxo-dGTP diphosphatase